MSDRIDWDKVGPYYTADIIDGPCKGFSGLVVGCDVNGVLVELEGFSIPTQRPVWVVWDDAAVYLPVKYSDACWMA